MRLLITTITLAGFLWTGSWTGPALADVARAPAPPASGWQIRADVQPRLNVPVDGFVSLGVVFQQGCGTADRFSTLSVAVSDNGAAVDGKVSEAAHLGGLLVWQSSAPLEPNRRYVVSVQANNEQFACGGFFENLNLNVGFDTGPGKAGGPLAAPTVNASRGEGCGSNFASFEVSSSDAPYVTYAAVGSSSGALGVNPQANSGLTLFIDPLNASGECVEITATHLLSGETNSQTVCTADVAVESMGCMEHGTPFGCAGGAPSQHWPTLVAVLALLGLGLVRRRPQVSRDGS